VTANRTFKLTITANTGVVLGTASTAIELTYTAKASEGSTEVAAGFVNLLHLNIVANGTYNTADLTNYVSATNGVITFQSAASAGSATITVSVVQVTAAYQVFSGDVTGYGSLRLSSSSNEPISIEVGEGSTEGHHGFKEVNVGDSTWDANDATYNAGAANSATVSGLSVASSSAAESAITALDAALEQVTESRAYLGAVENRLNHTVSNLSNVVENTSASQSRILDADFAAEAARLAKAQVLQQAGTAMLAQANAAPQNVLSLLG